MELVYNVNRDALHRRDQHKEDDTLCRLSSKNGVAFTSAIMLTEDGDTSAIMVTADGDSDSESQLTKAVSYVYVCDVDKPWEIYLIQSFEQKVLCMEWHSNGYEILIVTESGHCAIYKMQNYLMNEWECSHTMVIAGESFVSVSWFNHGIKIYLNGEKKDAANYSEKMYKERQAPPLAHFGNKATKGWIGITSTGLVCVALPKANSKEFHVESEALCTSRNRILIGDFLQDKNGDMLLVTSNGQVGPAINTYKISIKPAHEFSCTINIRATTSFFVRSALNETKQQNTLGNDEVCITHLQFVSREGGLSIIVAMGNASSSQVDLWNLTRNTVSLRRFFQQTTTPDNSVYNYQWSHVASITHPSLPVSIALPSFPVRYSSHTERSNNLLFQYIAIAYKDGSIKVISKQSFQAIATTNLDMGFNDVDKPEKRRKVVPCIVNMMQTFTGCGLLGFDQFGCMYLMKVVNTRDTLTQVHPNYLVSILEYLLVAGIDCWDVLISLKPGMIENVIQRLSDNFAKQPAVMQEIMFQHHMSIRASLYSCSAGGQQRSADCHCKILLHAISIHFKSQLRPKGLSAQEMGPVEKLGLICGKNSEGEIDLVIKALTPEKKEFFVDETTIQAMQPLIQWVADLVLYLLTSLPMTQGYGNNFPGYSILHDAACLGTLRELMVLIRIWGQINPRCHPHFTTTSNLDPMLEMFKILTRVWQTAKDNKGFDFEEALIDKCCLLSSQIYITNNEQLLFGNALSVGCCSILLQNYPMKYTFTEVPSQFANSGQNVRCCEAVGAQKPAISSQKIDVFHQINLGVSPSQATKSCSRCGNICLIDSVSNFPVIPPVIQAWEGKWLKQCLCGGMWVKGSFSQSANS